MLTVTAATVRPFVLRFPALPGRDVLRSDADPADDYSTTRTAPPTGGGT